MNLVCPGFYGADHYKAAFLNIKKILNLEPLIIKFTIPVNLIPS